MSNPGPGAFEQQPEEWWQAAVTALRQLTSKIDSSRIAALAISNQRETVGFLDEAGHSLRPAILWLDERCRPDGSSLELFAWGLRNAYGLDFRTQRTMQPEFMYPAAAAGDVDVISAYTSDGRIAQFGLRVLDDTRQAIPPYDDVLLISPKRVRDTALLDALRPLVGTLDVGLMREANRKAQAETPEAIARWLRDKIGK